MRMPRLAVAFLVPLPFLLALSILLAGALAADSLEALQREYEEARRAWKLSRTSAPRQKKAQQAEPVSIEQVEAILVRIGKLEGGAGIAFLAGEYGEAEPEIAAACAAALIESGDARALRIAIAGFDRGGKWSIPPKVRVLDLLAARGGDEGLAFLIKVARGGGIESRAIALGSLAARAPDEKARGAVLESLGHAAIEVRRAALRSARAFQAKETVDVLIDRADKEREPALRIDALQLLVDWTGINLGFQIADWRKWWEHERAGFTFAKQAGGGTRVATPDLQYFGIEVTSKRIAFLVDASNSMQGSAATGGGKSRKKAQGGKDAGKSKIEVLKEELSRILGALPEDTQVNIIPFARAPAPWKSELWPLAGRGRQEAIAFVRGLDLNLGTNIYDTLELALADRRVDTIYLLSDGMPYGGKFTRPDDICREIGAINRVRGARIHCIGFGRETEFLKRLAEENGGEYRAR